MASSAYRWTFFRAGGFDQVKLDSGEDLLHLEELDQKLWVALACPTEGLEIDKRTLELIDTDRDGRVRAPELIAAVKFAGMYLQNLDELLLGNSELPLTAIRNDSDAGRTLTSAARQILRNLGKAEAAALSVKDLAEPVRIFADSGFNGDGIITQKSAATDDERKIIAEIADCIGTEMDRCGEPGIGLTQIEAFFEELRGHANWLDEGDSKPEILVLGREKTSRAAQAVAAIRTKVDDYFTRCKLAVFDPRIAEHLNRKEDEYLEVAARDLSVSAVELAGFPLARVAAGKHLPFEGAVNPAHIDALSRLWQDAVVPLVGARSELTQVEWTRLCSELSAYESWQARKAGLRIEKLGEARIRELLASTLETRLRSLVDEDKALESEVKSIENVERLVRYYRDLYLLCTNFVNFRDFYNGGGQAVFQCGTLYLDQRSCRLCLRVKDPAAHATMAGLAGAYLVYVECKRPATSDKMHIVAAVTAGDSDNLMVGRNGLFYDRTGLDWDATITKIIDCPIGIRQAFWAPYKKFVRLIEQQVAKRAATSEAESSSTLGSVATAVANGDKATSLDGMPKKMDVGSVAALGVAVGAIGTFITAVVGYVTGILKLGILATVGAGIGMLLLISAPSVVLAYITLRKRNLGPILDATGWAVNANARINVSFGSSLTSQAKLPVGAQRIGKERYADTGLPWKRWVFLGLVLLLAYRWGTGSLDRYIPAPQLRAQNVLGAFFPGKRP